MGRAVARLRSLADLAPAAALFAALTACSPPPEQPDLNTYGAIQPICILGCNLHMTLTEGDAAGAVTSSVTSSDVIGKQ